MRAMPHREVFLGFRVGAIHGATCGKRYEFMPRCEECLVEAWEHMSDAGLQVIHNTRFGVFYLLGEAFTERRKDQ